MRRANDDGPCKSQVTYFRDTYAEHPEDRENIEYTAVLETDDALTTLSGMYEQVKTLGFNLAYTRFVRGDKEKYSIFNGPPRR